MTSPDTQFDITRLRTPAAALIVFGLLVGAAAFEPFSAPISLMGDLVFWPVDGSPNLDGAPVRLLSAIAGGLMTGWGATLLALAQGRSLRQAVLFGGLAWFLVDSTGSVLAGAMLNAVFNLGFLALFLIAVRPRSRDQLGGTRAVN
jgi:hypothetical protein